MLTFKESFNEVIEAKLKVPKGEKVAKELTKLGKKKNVTAVITSKFNLYIEGVKFDWISDDTSDVGVIAQDIERCLPELVTEVNETKTVNYNGLIGLLIESVKELSKDNQLMRMEIDSLRQ